MAIFHSENVNISIFIPFSSCVKCSVKMRPFECCGKREQNEKWKKNLTSLPFIIIIVIVVTIIASHSKFLCAYSQIAERFCYLKLSFAEKFVLSLLRNKNPAKTKQNNGKWFENFADPNVLCFMENLFRFRSSEQIKKTFENICLVVEVSKIEVEWRYK